MLTPEELLKPRYKVIADYPDSIHRPGKIILEEEWPLPFEDDTSFKDYPSIFKKLEWWEERGENQFVGLQYVKWSPGYDDENEVYKVDYVGTYRGMTGVFLNGDKFPHQFLPNYKFHPATEEEYNNYIKSKA